MNTVEGTCGGIAVCPSCHVYVVPDHILPEKTFDEMPCWKKVGTCKVTADFHVN